MSVTGMEINLELTVHSRRVLASGVVTIELQRRDGALLPPWNPGAHIELHLPLGGPGAAEIARQYSLCGDPHDLSSWRIAVLLEPSGRGGSRFIHEHLVAGASVGVRGPRNHFRFEASPRYLFIAGGIGITPLIPMMTAASASGADWTLAYGGRTRTSMAFVDELAAAHGSKISIHPQDTHGLLDLATMLDEPKRDTQVYCCGPEPLLDAVEDACAGWPQGALHVEHFAPKSVGAGARSGPFEVEIASNGRVLEVSPEQTVMEVLQGNGLFIDSSCEEGTCGSCEVTVIEGAIDHRDSVLTATERAEGKYMLVCVSRSAGPRLVLDL